LRERHDVNFPLLADEGGRATRTLGVLREDQEKANRAAFLLGPDGKITGVYPKISPETHSDAILKHVAFL